MEEMTKISNVDIDVGDWESNGWSKESKEFLLQLLTKKGYRMTAIEALDHPWMKQASLEDSSIVRNVGKVLMNSNKSMSNLEKCLRLYMSSRA